MRAILIFALNILIISNHKAQLEDNIWLFGTSSSNYSNLEGYAYGNTILDFSNGEPRIYFDSMMTLDFRGTNASICNKEGKLMIYTNGMQVHNGLHQIVNGCDTISYGDLWEIFNFKDFPKVGQNWLPGFNSIQGALILPWPSEDNTYGIFYPMGYDTDNFYTFNSFNYTKVTIDNSYQNTKTVFKDKTILEDDFIPGMINACRHANGRDWWIVNRSIDRQFLFLYLFDNIGARLSKRVKINENFETESDKLGQLYFSDNGDKMAFAESIIWPFDSIYIELYDFDRSTGELKALMKDTIKNNRVHGTLAFSPSGQYMYVSNHYEMFQYDITAADIKSSKQKIGDYDGHKFKYNEFDDGTSTEFGAMAHGPDGKIYIVPESSNRYLHTIEYPDEEGLASNLVQRKYMLPTSNHVSVPNFPHYRLGPLDGSSADTLGLDNHPIAKFRYESDTTSYLDVRFTDISYFRPESWQWDFGDGTTFTGKKPFIHSFPKDGTYTVCLAVSNENSTNTSCKSITIGPNATDDDAVIKDNTMVTLFPNPVDKEMVLTIHDYIPKNGIIEIYDIVGQKVQSQSVSNGWNNIDVGQLKSGTYIYIVSDGYKKIGVGRFVKM